MGDMYTTVTGPVVVQTEEKRSVFEAWVRRAGDERAAKAIIEEARVAHPGAGHHCWAYLLGPGREIYRSSDDGEPGGTAGLPMQEVLQGSPYSDVVAVVTRWFGGVLLGSGGLVRAYSGAVRVALAEAKPLVRERVQLASVEVGHDIAGRLEHDLRARGIEVRHVEYGAGVRLHTAIAAADRDAATGLVASLSGGSGHWQLGETDWVDQKPDSVGFG